MQILGRQDNRHHLIITNMDSANNVYIGNSSNVTTNTGFQIGPNTTPPKLETSEAIYAVTDAGKTARISIVWEYSVGV